MEVAMHEWQVVFCAGVVVGAVVGMPLGYLITTWLWTRGTERW